MTEGQERVQLQVLGPVTVEPALSGPRRIAVLVYLALARPHGLHSRDTLIALLWPDADQAGGRHALRNALHALKRALGPVIVTSGDAMVGVDPDLLECDALDLEADVAAGRYEQAFARYHGEVLQGFFVSDAPEFERWLDGERRRLGDAARSAAWGRAESLRAEGDIAAAMSGRPASGGPRVGRRGVRPSPAGFSRRRRRPRRGDAGVRGVRRSAPR